MPSSPASLRAQPQHRLGVQLRDARLGHAEDLADLAQRQVLVVVEGDHELLALGQGARSRRRSGRAARTGRRAPGGRARRGRAACRAARPGRRWRPTTLHSSSSATIVEFEICSSASWNSSTVISSSAAISSSVGARWKPRLELHVDALDLARAGAHRARHPVERAQLVDDRAADPRDRVGLELDLAAESRSARSRRSGPPSP